MEEHPDFEQNMHQLGEWAWNRYGEDLQAWGESPTVRAAEAHKEAMLHTSKELHTLMSDALYMEVTHGGVDMGW